jgi:hypothetical protein
MHMMVYSSPGEMFRALSEAFAAGSVFGFGACVCLWRWSHKQRLKRESKPPKASKFREAAEFGPR